MHCIAALCYRFVTVCHFAFIVSPVEMKVGSCGAQVHFLHLMAVGSKLSEGKYKMRKSAEPGIGKHGKENELCQIQQYPET